MSESRDAELIAKVERGDESALASLYDAYSRTVYAVALRVLHDPSTAEDVLQEVFLQLWRSPGSFCAVRGRLGGWLAVIARNRSIDVLRQRRPMESIEDMPITSNYDLACDVERLVMIQKVRLLIAKLPVAQRAALNMAFFQGCTHAEIAEETGIPLGTVKTRVRSALRTLGAAFPNSTGRVGGSTAGVPA